jgi:hypothetical protein
MVTTVILLSKEPATKKAGLFTQAYIIPGNIIFGFEAKTVL